MGYSIRWAKKEEWLETMNMIWKTFLKFEGEVYSEEGVQNFFDFITNVELYNAFLQGRYQLLLALDGDRVVGAGSLRNLNYLSLLFVDEEYHHKGVGSALMTELCEYLRTEVGIHYMSLRAAPVAVDFYKKLGFHATGEEEFFDGIRVTPMECYF